MRYVLTVVLIFVLGCLARAELPQSTLPGDAVVKAAGPLPPQSTLPAVPADRLRARPSPCSALCTCGCNQGEDCDCARRAAAAPGVISGTPPPPPAFFAPQPSHQPRFFRGGLRGGCAGGSCR